MGNTCGWLLVAGCGYWLLVVVVVVVAVCVYVETADGYCSGAGCGTLASALNGKQQYKKDDQAVVFIEVTNTASNMAQRAPFFPQVDEFSVLEIPDSGSLFYRNESITVSVVMGNNAHATPPRAYTDGSSFVGYYSALIHMRNGRVLRIEWDEGCSGCPDGCVANNCALPYASYGSPCLDPECAIKVYVVWLGTDKDDQVLTSPSLLPSNFRRFALSPVVKDASAVSGNTVDRAQENPPAA